MRVREAQRKPACMYRCMIKHIWNQHILYSNTHAMYAFIPQQVKEKMEELDLIKFQMTQMANFLPPLNM